MRLVSNLSSTPAPGYPTHSERVSPQVQKLVLVVALAGTAGRSAEQATYADADQLFHRYTRQHSGEDHPSTDARTGREARGTQLSVKIGDSPRSAARTGRLVASLDSASHVA